MKKINLNVDPDSNAVIANEGGKPTNKGNLCSQSGEELKWQGKYQDGAGNFLVTFKNEGTGVYPDWPCTNRDPDDPSSKALHVPAKDGRVECNIMPGLWKYSVAYDGSTGVTPLDPMIIVRDRGDAGSLLSTGTLMVALLSFVAGAAAAGWFGRRTRSRAR